MRMVALDATEFLGDNETVYVDEGESFNHTSHIPPPKTLPPSSFNYKIYKGVFTKKIILLNKLNKNIE